MSFGTESSGKRGISWRHREILDLLHFWGEEKIQEALKSTHRNLDYFQRISEQMAARGHRRSALECRSKTKTMRLEYKKVVAHNARSGNAPITCPYYRELESILRGDASVHPKRLARSMVLQVMGQVRTEQVVLQEGSEELFSHDLVTINGEDIMMSSPCHSGDLSDQCNENGYGFEVDLDTTPDGLNQHDEEQFGGGGQAAWNEKENNPPRDQIGVAAPQGFEAPDTAEAVSPGTRLANIRRRRRGGAVINHAAERFLSQASEEHREEMAMREKEQQATWRWREEESRRQQEFMEETRQERRMFQERWSQNIDVMRAAVDTLKTLGEAIMLQQVPIA